MCFTQNDLCVKTLVNGSGIMKRSKQTLLKILLVVGALCLLQNLGFLKFILHFVFTSDGQKRNRIHQQSIIRKITEEEFAQSDNDVQGDSDAGKNEDDEKEECEIPYLKNRVGSHGEELACKRLRPVTGSCRVAKKLFANPYITDCDTTEGQNGHICNIQVSRGMHKMFCNISTCKFPVVIGVIPYSTGEITWQKYTNQTSFDSATKKLLEPEHVQSHYGIVFFKCLKSGYEAYMYDVLGDQSLDDDFEFDNMYSSFYHLQLLLLPASLYMQGKLKSSPGRPVLSDININMIFIDSVSRSHFYRSLPETVKVLETINLDYAQRKKRSDSGLVLDFELFQGLRSRTFESLQALFAGYVNPYIKPFGVFEMPPHRLATEVLLGPAKKLGYHTLWIEDLCWHWEWGISKDLKAFTKTRSRSEVWSNLTKALEKAGIDSLGVTLAGCEVMKANDVPDPFHGPDAVCYGQKYQHEYNLEYLEDYQEYLIQNKQSFFTFFQTNINHESSGVRIKTIDKHFANYLKFARQLSNTLTIIFSDHGNTYGEFIDKTEEGRIEIYHPAMFMILPPNVQKQIGNKKMSSLIGNQANLISILDLHFMLRDILQISSPSVVPGAPINIKSLYKVSDDGLFSPVSPHRTCDVMPRIMPHLCICEGFDNPMMNNSYHAVYAHFASSQLNEVLHSQYRKHNPGSKTLYGQCRPLVVKQFRNVKSNFEVNNTLIIKMDLEVQLFEGQKPAVFFVAVAVHQKKKSMELTRFDRLTAYSPFQKCKDIGIDSNLCVCDVQANSMKTSDVNDHSFDPKPVFADVTVRKVEESVVCLYVITTENDHFVMIQTVNKCLTKKIRLQIKFQRRNLLLVRKIDLNQIVLKPFEVKLVLFAVQKNRGEKINWKLLLSVQGS